uniref:Uncharacterized protein n=1 Tax=Medicago truncatula TaxID=3880 RepID=I3SMF6_MEDTR|nr:unknown [Medicago truncatula]
MKREIMFLIGIEKKVFNPTNITIGSNPFVTIPKWICRTSFFFLC